MGRKKKTTNCPDYRLLIEPTWQALVQLGGSGTNSEIDAEIIRQLALPDAVVDEPHKETGNETELEYRAKWARTYLKKYGLIENSTRGVWSIAPQYQKMVEQVKIDAAKIVHVVRQQFSRDRNGFDDNTNEQELTMAEVSDEERSWERRLAGILMEMNPYGFEKLAQRLLRECGFSQVAVTKKSGDGGIDGNGKLKVNGILTFNVAFQCKRYKGVVGAADIRDFRGSLTTDIEKGIFITTGTFSKAARDEAVSPGKQQIDLIDGEELIQKLAEYNIGLHPVNSYEIDEEYFRSL